MKDVVRGTLNLQGAFQAVAEELKLACDQGRILHRTKNIRDSGSPLEGKFRKFLGDRLPAPYQVGHGYLFDAGSVCTQQIDAFVAEADDIHRIVELEGATYVPYPSARAFFEIKLSATDLTAHLAQVAERIVALNAMRRATLAQQGSAGPVYFEPLSFLVVGDSSEASLAALKAWEAAGQPRPDFIVFVDRGIVVAQRFAQLADDELGFFDHRQPGAWTIFKPKDGECRAGTALLWVYFLIVANLNFSVRGNITPMHGFTEEIRRRYPLHAVATVEDAVNW